MNAHDESCICEVCIHTFAIHVSAMARRFLMWRDMETHAINTYKPSSRKFLFMLLEAMTEILNKWLNNKKIPPGTQNNRLKYNAQSIYIFEFIHVYPVSLVSVSPNLSSMFRSSQEPMSDGEFAKYIGIPTNQCDFCGLSIYKHHPGCDYTLFEMNEEEYEREYGSVDCEWENLILEAEREEDEKMFLEMELEEMYWDNVGVIEDWMMDYKTLTQ